MGFMFMLAPPPLRKPRSKLATSAVNLGEKEPAARLMKAIEAVTAKRILTPDLGGKANTDIVTEAVCDAL